MPADAIRPPASGESASAVEPVASGMPDSAVSTPASGMPGVLLGRGDGYQGRGCLRHLMGGLRLYPKWAPACMGVKPAWASACLGGRNQHGRVKGALMKAGSTPAPSIHSIWVAVCTKELVGGEEGC